MSELKVTWMVSVLSVRAASAYKKEHVVCSLPNLSRYLVTWILHRHWMFLHLNLIWVLAMKLYLRHV